MRGRKNIRVILIALASFFVLSCWLLAGKGQSQEKDTIGERFHKETSITWGGVIGDLFRAKPKKPPQYKTYLGAKVVQLPRPAHRGMPVEESIQKRRSLRDYSSKSVNMNQLSELLFAAQGITDKTYEHDLRSAPSAGALYPFEIYLVVNSVQNLGKGVYHYDVRGHALELVTLGDFSRQMTDAGLKQDMFGKAAVTFVMSAIFDRVRHKYGERGFRYVYIEAGHISQNISLEAVSLGLGSVCAGAFLDENVNEIVGVDGYQEAVIYLHAVGTL